MADHRSAVQLRGRLTQELVARAVRRCMADDLDGAIDDLHLGERMGAAPDTLAAARLSLADHVAGEVRAALEAGEPARVLERLEHLARHKIGGPALRRCREVAEAWQAAQDEVRRGEFGRAHDQLDRAERLAAGVAQAGLAATRRDVEARHKAVTPKVEALYAALASGPMPAILAAAEAVLETVPEHPAARQARTRAWQQIAAISPSAAWPNRGARVPQAQRRHRPRPRWSPSPSHANTRARRRRSPGSTPQQSVPEPAPPRHAPWPAPARTGRAAGFCSGSMRSADILSVWTIRLSSAVPVPTAMPTSR